MKIEKIKIKQEFIGEVSIDVSGTRTIKMYQDNQGIFFTRENLDKLIDILMAEKANPTALLPQDNLFKED